MTDIPPTVRTHRVWTPREVEHNRVEFVKDLKAKVADLNEQIELAHEHGLVVQVERSRHAGRNNDRDELIQCVVVKVLQEM